MTQRLRICRDLPGWIWLGDKLHPLDTVAGLLARGAEIMGRCKTGECRRSVAVDLGSWLEHGYGEVSLEALRRIYRCARVGCDLILENPFYAQGIPLAYYVGGEDRLRVTCGDCGAGRLMQAEELIARLERAGITHAGNAGVRIVGGLIRGACKACGGRSWTVELKSPPAPGTPGYAKAQGVGRHGEPLGW